MLRLERIFCSFPRKSQDYLSYCGGHATAGSSIQNQVEWIHQSDTRCHFAGPRIFPPPAWVFLRSGSFLFHFCSVWHFFSHILSAVISICGYLFQFFLANSWTNDHVLNVPWIVRAGLQLLVLHCSKNCKLIQPCPHSDRDQVTVFSAWLKPEEPECVSVRRPRLQKL